MSKLSSLALIVMAGIAGHTEETDLETAQEQN